MITTDITWLSEQQRDAMVRLAHEKGYGTIGDYVRMLADAQLEAEKWRERDKYQGIEDAYIQKRRQQ